MAVAGAGPFGCQCLNIQPCPVSTPRSSNRTCPIKASGSRTQRSRRLACNAAWSVPAYLGGPRLTSLSRPSARRRLVVNSGPFAPRELTRFRATTGPSATPPRPGLTLAGFRLTVPRRHRGGFPCCAGSPCTDMPSSLPRWARWFMSLLRRHAPAPSPLAAAFPDQFPGRRPH